jgi:hypothetical protein
LHPEKLHDLYASPNIFTVITTMKMTRAVNVETMGNVRDSYKILIVETLGRQRRKWEGNIEKHLKEQEWKVWTRPIWLGIRPNDGLL